MIHSSPGARFRGLALLFTAVATVGCGNPETVTEKSPAELAKETLGVKETGTTSETTATTQKQVDVIQQTKVIDKETGKVLSDVKKVTPVSVTKEKEVQTDVNVDVGKTVKTVD